MFVIDSEKSVPEREEKILAFWQKENILKATEKLRAHAPFFSTYDGPPFATGLPHYGHLLTGTIKDTVLRYKTMKGFLVPRRFGWDCHGLPIENEIEKAKELSGVGAIEAFGIAQFNEECRSIVFRYTKEWEKTVNRMGRWVDFQETYRTMDPSYMESVWWVFSQLYGKGLVYEGFKVMPFSTKLGTPLSNFEANLNYKEVDDPSLTVIFSLIDEPQTGVLAWTTTPWSLVSNLGLAVHPAFDYVKVREKSGAVYILLKERVAHYFKDPVETLATYKGKDLVDLRYKPLFPYFSQTQNAFRIIADEFVGTEEGTGIVSMAPAFGEVDFFVCTREGIDPVCPVDQNGRFTQEVSDFVGMYVKDADKEIIRRLKSEKKVFQHTQIRHRYPFCWRSDTPLIYKAVRTWFVEVEKIKEKMCEVNSQVHWVPLHIKQGRFGKWLENARDWAISRNRYWGTPIPIWRSQDGDYVVISSKKELEERTHQKIEDLHRHFIDDLTFLENGKEFKRIPEVFDCWFESGSMPYAQNHFPFENQEETLRAFPADFICEGIDQTRGWFYTLTVLATALFNQPPIKNVIVNGIILAEDGAKMSKRLKNYPEPEIVIEKYGADAIRLYLLNSPAVYAEDLKFSERGVEQVLRQFLIPYWNAFVFFATYANIYHWKPSYKNPKADIDRWILSKLQQLIEEVSLGMENYELNKAVAPFVSFIDELTNWYIRRSRSRFWSEIASEDRDEAFSTLYEVLLTLTKIAAPFIPFLSEEIYRSLRDAKDPISVHLCDFPEVQTKLRDSYLEEVMHLVQRVVNMGHSLRKENKLKVRQPLALAFIVASDEKLLEKLKDQASLIMDELNVKELFFDSDESRFVKMQAKPHFRILGKKVGSLMPKAQQVIALLSKRELEILERDKQYTIHVDHQEIHLTPEDVVIERKVLEGLIASTDKELTIALDTTLTESLLEEGLAREIVNKINTMRRDQQLAVTDRIIITMETTEKVRRCFEAYKDYICHETLITRFTFAPCEGVEWDLNGEPTKIALTVDKKFSS